MAHTQFDRRKLLAAGLAFGVTGTALGLRAVLAHEGEDHDGTPVASPAAQATPGATPAATPGATPAAGGGNDVTVTATEFDFEPAELSIPADTDVEIVVVNQGILRHDFTLEETDVGTPLIGSDERTTLTLNLRAGDYTYYCSVPGHREAGMEGTLRVE